MDDQNALNVQFESMLEQIKELFFELGIKNLNMDDISRKLGISKKTLYRFVNSKEDLVAKLFEYERIKGEKKFEDIYNQNVNAIEKLFNVSLTVYEEMKRFKPMLMFELRKYYEQLFTENQSLKLASVSTQMKRNLQQGILEGLYRVDINIDAVVVIYINYLIELHRQEFCAPLDLSFDDLFTVMFENHIRAISTPEGVAFFECRKKEITENLNKNIN